MIQVTEDELATIVGGLDYAVKQGGLRVARSVVPVLDAIQARLESVAAVDADHGLSESGDAADAMKGDLAHAGAAEQLT